MTSDSRNTRRVRIRIRRCKDGFIPVVLIGEQPISFDPEPTKSKARDVARARAANLKHTGFSMIGVR